jgi:hypothetical protein
MGKFYAALSEGREWAVAMGMRNLHGFDAGRGGFQIDPAALTDGVPQIGAEVIFVVPGYGGSEREAEVETSPRPASAYCRRHHVEPTPGVGWSRTAIPRPAGGRPATG